MQSSVLRAGKPIVPLLQKSEEDQWAGPSNIALFVRCLRLLDLDLLPDCPGITESVFSSSTAQQNLQARIKAVEWSLYRLFEIYDPKGTHAKLRPFFPPLAPLQSLNLRAALYRALTELKKNGVLGRDVVLRKTMLDDCKGQKLEEALKEFALVVLQTACDIRHPELGLNQIKHIPKEQLVPLILAYRHSLQQSSKRHQSLSQEMQLSLAKLDLARTDLQHRLEVAQQEFEPVDEEDLRRLSEKVRNAWAGDDRWLDVLLQGRRQPVIPLLPEPFESASTGSADHTLAPQVESTDVVTDLTERITEQENRLKKWKTFYASMTNSQNGNLQPLESQKPIHSSPVRRFDQHKGLRLGSQPQGPAEERLEPYHTSLLRNMYNELIALHCIVPLATTLDSGRDDNNTSYCEADTSVYGSGLVAHHGPIGTREVLSMISSAQKKHPIISNNMTENVPHLDMNKSIHADDANTTAHRNVKIPEISEGAVFPSHSEDKISIPSCPLADHTIGDDILQVSSHGPKETAGTRKVSSSRRVSKSTSTEMSQDCTRALLQPFVMNLSHSDTHSDQAADNKNESSQVLPPLPAAAAFQGTLLERTRQSMSLLANPPQQPSPTQPQLSESYPINPFETPSKAQTTQPRTWSPRSGSSTPKDRLFSEEAEYASVFKSRPRVALSPSLSPERSDQESYNIAVAGLETLDLRDS